MGLNRVDQVQFLIWLHVLDVSVCHQDDTQQSNTGGEAELDLVHF